MKQEVMRQFDIDWIPITGLIIFMICFLLYVYFTYKKSNKSFYDKAAFMPLDEEHSSYKNVGGN